MNTKTIQWETVRIKDMGMVRVNAKRSQIFGVCLTVDYPFDSETAQANVCELLTRNQISKIIRNTLE